MISTNNHYHPMIRAKYAIYGAMIGDAMGATVEFMLATEAINTISRYSEFKHGLVGKGQFELLPGQFTDDTEMALAIMSVIATHGKYDQFLVADAYRKWYASKPFDIGKTTILSVSQKNLDRMLDAAKKYNMKSLSNGFLMRLFGLVTMYWNKKLEELLCSIKMDVELTHTHPEALKIAIVYSVMLWKAINGLNADQIYLWARDNSQDCQLLSVIFKAVDTNQSSFKYKNNVYSDSSIDSYHIGFVGYAIWLLLRSIRQYNSYKLAMLDIVKKGGDSDTNACIVGAVMAALYPETIPTIWVENIVNCRAPRYSKYSLADPRIWTKWLP